MTAAPPRPTLRSSKISDIHPGIMMSPTKPIAEPPTSGVTAFVDDRMIARGVLPEVARVVHGFAGEQPIIFDDATGRSIDLDLRGSADDAAARVSSPTETSKPGRGRPKLGVTAREVTLLPRHWEWLATQPGGASASLRRLVDEARRQSSEVDAIRSAKEATYRVMTTLGGNRPAYEEAVRALFADDLQRMSAQISNWPADIASYVQELALRGARRT